MVGNETLGRLLLHFNFCGLSGFRRNQLAFYCEKGQGRGGKGRDVRAGRVILGARRVEGVVVALALPREV